MSYYYRDPLYNSGGMLTTVLLGAIILDSIFVPKINRQKLDLTQNLQIKFEGENGHGTVSSIKNRMQYSYEGVDALEDSLTYTFSPEPGTYSINDEVVVTVNYDKSIAEKYQINVQNNVKKLHVAYLLKPGSQYSPWTLKAETPEKPSADLLASTTSNPQMQEPSEPLSVTGNTKEAQSGAVEYWMQGEAAAYHTGLPDKVFDSYPSAFHYGINSSQEFKVHGFLNDEGVMKYETIFKPSEKEPA